MKRKLTWCAWLVIGLLLARFLWLIFKPISVNVEFTAPMAQAEIQHLFAAGVPTNTPTANFRMSHAVPYGGTNSPVSMSELYWIRLQLAAWGMNTACMTIRESMENIEIQLSDGPLVMATKWPSQGWRIAPGPTPQYVTQEAAEKNKGNMFSRLFRWWHFREGYKMIAEPSAAPLPRAPQTGHSEGGH